MSRLDNSSSSKKIPNKYGKVGFPINTIPSLPFQPNVNYSIPSNHLHNINLTNQLHNETPVTKYKSSSKLNSPKGQVRFSIPINTVDNDNNMDNAITGEIPTVPISTSPIKIVFPKDPSDSESQSSIVSSIDNNANTNECDENVEMLARVGIEGHLVDMKSKIMVNVPEEIWNFHHNRKQNKLHQRTKSMDDTSLNRNPINNNSTPNSNKNHHRSRSLQSIISQTLNEFNSFNEPYDSSFSTSNINNSQISQVSPLNYTSSINSNSILRTPNKPTTLYLTSDSPINKHNVPIPLEISLPPFLSPENKNKKRNSLIYDGESYSVYNEEEESISSLSRDEEEEEGISTSGSISDSVVSTNSLPSITYNISFDANTPDPDSLLGIDNEANVNLKRQLRNLRRQKNDTIDNKEKSNEFCPKILPPLPVISRNVNDIENNNINHQPMENVIKSSLSPSRDTTQHNSLPMNQHSSRKNSDHLLPNHSRLSKMIDEYNSFTNTSSPINRHSFNNNSSSVRTDDYTNDSLAILATPPKSIIIPDLDDLPLTTPSNISQSFTSTNNFNSSLEFFDQFEPLYPNNTIASPISNPKSYGKLDTSFKFPPLPSQQLKTPVKQDHTNNINNDNIQDYNQQVNNDYQKTPQDTKQVEERRQKLLASHLSPNNKIGHSHRRSRSIRSMDFMTPQKFTNLEDLPSTPSLPFNATSTPPEETPNTPRRSSSRLKTPVTIEGKTATQNNQLITNIMIPSENINSKSPNSNNNNISDHKLQYPIKHLSSFQSFSTPIKKLNLIPNVKIDEVSKKEKSYNLLSPRRQLSNPGSNQSSSVNSQFSKNSQLTQTTVATEVSSNNMIGQKIKPNFPNNVPNTNNDSYTIIKEKQKDGRIVDVIVLDDDDDDDNKLNNNSKGRHEHNTIHNNSNKHMLDNNKEKRYSKSSPKMHKSPLRRKYNLDTKKEQMSYYMDLYEMCENTAIKAKETIFELAGVSPSSKANI